MSYKTIITALLAIVALNAMAQTAFDPKEGCLNVVDFTYGKGFGEYGDRCISANYMHEKFINEQFSIGGGIGYSHHRDYKFSAIPVYLSTHYFFLNKCFSPFANLRVGGFAMFNTKNAGTNEKHSISKEKQGVQFVYFTQHRHHDAYYTKYRYISFCE